MIRDHAKGREHRGLATILAIVLIGLVGASLAGMAAYCGAEFRRSRVLADGARLRQLLLAGAADVMAHTPTAQVQTWTLSLPDPLKDDARVEIELEPALSGATSAHITARVHGHVARQTVRLVQTGSNWELESADLESQ